MSKPKILAEAADDTLREIERVGLNEAIGWEDVPPGRRIDPAKCQCGRGCESPLECEFWYYVCKTNAMERAAHRQVKIDRFRVDSLFDCDGQKVVVELDGKEFHDDLQDMKRDDVLLQSVDAIIRIPFAAMHFYPHATFSVLAQWYPRFQLRAADIFCIPIPQLKIEMAQALEGDGDFQNARQWLEWAEPNFELWGEAYGIGWVGSPKAWLNSWNVKPITLRKKGDSSPHVTRRGARNVVGEEIYQSEKRDEDFREATP